VRFHAAFLVMKNRPLAQRRLECAKGRLRPRQQNVDAPGLLKLGREIERRLQAAFGTTDADPHALTVSDALAALSRLCLLEYQIDETTNLTRLPNPDARQKEILAALGVSLPKK
jgi:hypothetical protein